MTTSTTTRLTEEVTAEVYAMEEQDDQLEATGQLHALLLELIDLQRIVSAARDRTATRARDEQSHSYREIADRLDVSRPLIQRLIERGRVTIGEFSG